MKAFAPIFAFVCFSVIACEQHDFEGENGTKRLHEHHGSHDDHGDHSGHDDHGKKHSAH